MLRITAVNYLNTYPFVFGLKESGLMKNFSLDLQVPSMCAKKLIENSTDIALIPVGAIPEAGKVSYLSDFCIGAIGPVKTVLLLSMVPLEEISMISLDFDSRTSVELVKVLAGNYWKIEPSWQNLQAGEVSSIKLPASVVAIGDKTFSLRQRYPYVYDLAAEWVNFTGAPFVFAVWASRKKLPDEVIRMFNQALSFGIRNKAASLEYFKDQLPGCGNCLDYLENDISYTFDAEKRRGMEMFLNYLLPSY